MEQLVRQRVFALALGYEDIDDHDDLRRDRAQCDTIRLRLLMIGARVTVSMWRVRLHCSDSHPGQALFRAAALRIATIPMRC